MTSLARVQIALLFYSCFCVVCFTAAVYAATMFPPLVPNAGLWIAGLTAAGMFIGAPLAWLVGKALPREWHSPLVARQSPLAHEPAREV